MRLPANFTADNIFTIMASALAHNYQTSSLVSLLAKAINLINVVARYFSKRSIFSPNDSRLKSIENFLDYKYNVPYLSNTHLKVAEKLVFKTLAVSCLRPYVAMAAVFTD